MGPAVRIAHDFRHLRGLRAAAADGLQRVEISGSKLPEVTRHDVGKVCPGIASSLQDSLGLTAYREGETATVRIRFRLKGDQIESVSSQSGPPVYRSAARRAVYRLTARMPPAVRRRTSASWSASTARTMKPKAAHAWPCSSSDESAVPTAASSAASGRASRLSAPPATSRLAAPQTGFGKWLSQSKRAITCQCRCGTTLPSVARLILAGRSASRRRALDASHRVDTCMAIGPGQVAELGHVGSPDQPVEGREIGILGRADHPPPRRLRHQGHPPVSLQSGHELINMILVERKCEASR